VNFTFYKYQGTGNDFIMIDNRNLQFPIQTETIAHLCHRRFGIGADGLILLQHKPGFDFEMLYFNADGRTSSMCGNGGRCIIKFAFDLGIIKNKCTFMAIDGEHEGKVSAEGVSLKMIDVQEVAKTGNDFFINTGSPHYVAFRPIQTNSFINDACAIRNNDIYKEKGVNVNFVEINDMLEMRTYERGVEDETYSCGTGVTAAAIAAHYTNKSMNIPIHVKTKGGELSVSFTPHTNGTYTDIWLSGAAKKVFAGTIEL
jgi:diaminopimelate epimerase